MRFVFFSLRDFKIDVGETVRMYGILNSLASSGNEVVFISNARRYDMFYTSIRHVYIGYEFKEKRKFQSLLALFPYQIAYKQFKELFSYIERALQNANIGKEPVYFFDYLDNSVGYLLKKKGLIAKYVNDVHGIATLEFESHVRNSKSIFGKLVNRLKYHTADQLDKKVFEYADGLIYGSGNMRNYYEHNYHLANKRTCVIPYLLGGEAIHRKVDSHLRNTVLKEWKLRPEDFVVLFVGTYKPTAGVEDLIVAFDQLFSKYNSCKLFLIGSGPLKARCVKLSNELQTKNAIHFIDSIPYSQLFTYQSLANVIVCPDKDNPYSHYVIHVKYFDALISGKLVINGAFESVKEINQNDFLSLTFEPSNVDDLFKKLVLCKENYDLLRAKYKGSKEYAEKYLTYTSYIDRLKGSFFSLYSTTSGILRQQV